MATRAGVKHNITHYTEEVDSDIRGTGVASPTVGGARLNFGFPRAITPYCSITITSGHVDTL